MSNFSRQAFYDDFSHSTEPKFVTHNPRHGRKNSKVANVTLLLGRIHTVGR